MTALSTRPLRRSFSFEGDLHLRRTLGQLVSGKRDPVSRLDGNLYARATRTPEGPATFLVRHTGPGRIDAEGYGPGAAWALGRVPALLALDEEPVDTSRFSAEVQAMAAACKGLRLPRTGRVFELVMPIVLEQLVTGAESKRAWRRLVGAFAERAPGPFEDLFLPPSPAQVRSIPSDEFLSLGILRKQGLTLRTLAERAHRMEEAATMSADDAFRRLTALRGIGPWTAGCAMLYGLGHRDAVPVGDYHLPNLVAWNFAGEDRADDRRMMELLEPYRGVRGLVLLWLRYQGAAPPSYGPRRPRRAIGRPAWRSAAR